MLRISSYIRFVNKLRLLAGYEVVTKSNLWKEMSKLALNSVLVFFALYVLLTYYGMSYPYPLIISALNALPIALFMNILVYLLKIIKRARCIENELRYFIVSEGITADKTTELINDLMGIEFWGSVFTNLKAEALKLRKLKKLLPTFDAVKIYVKFLRSSFVRRILGDYLLSMSLGTVPMWLQEKSNELLHEIKARSIAISKIRAIISILNAILLSYLPMFMLMISLVTGNEGIILQSLIIALTIAIVSILLVPKPPLHQSINIKRSSLNVLMLSMVYLAPFTIFVLFKVIDKALYLFSMIAVIYGLIRLRDYIEALFEVSDIPRVINLISETPLTLVNPLEVLKRVLSTSKSKSMREIASNLSFKSAFNSLDRIKTWLGRYVIYVLLRGIGKGSLDRERLIKLRDVVLELITDLRSSLAVNIIIISLALALPYILTVLLNIGYMYTMHTSLNYLSLYAIITTFTYSVYAGYVVFNDSSNTLIQGVSMLMLLALGGVRL